MIGFMVPNQKQLLELASKRGVRGSWEELCRHQAVEEMALEVISEAALAGESCDGIQGCVSDDTQPLLSMV